MRRAERVFLALSTFLCLTFVFSLRDSGPKYVTASWVPLPPVPVSVKDRPGSVAVAVEDDQGQPISGASVRVLSIREEKAYLAGAARTDAAGKARVKALPTGETWILVEAEGKSRASTRLVVDESEREAKLRLRMAAMLAVAVVDDGGAPIADAWIEARTGDPLPFVTRSGADGKASIARLGPPPWMLRVSAPGYDTVKPSVPKAPTEPLKVALRKLGWMDVATVDRDGRAVSDAVVFVAGSGLWPARKIRTDREGHAKVPDLPRGIYDLRATRGDAVSPAQMGVLLGRGESKSVTLVLAPGRRIEVHVTDGEGDDALPVPSASVVLAEGGLSSFPLEASTDAKGDASLGPIAPGEAFLSARADGFVPRTGVPVPSSPTGALRIALSRGGTLRGDVVDARGFPIDGASVEVVGATAAGEPIDESPDRIAFRSAHFSWALTGPRDLVAAGELGVMKGAIPGIPHAGSLPTGLLRGSGTSPPPEPWVTRDNGSFRAFPVPPGRVRAIVRHAAYVEGISDLVTLAAGGEASVRVVLRGGASLEGRVFDDRHVPVAGARVDIAATRGSLERTSFSGSDGTFAFASVPSEIVLSVFRAEAMDDVALRTNVKLEEGERKDVELVLPLLREPVTVSVTDEQSVALEGSQIQVLSLAPDAPLRRTLFADRDGRATFKDSRGLPIRLSVSHKGRAPFVKELDAAPADIKVELPGGIDLNGLVTTRRGRDPLEGADVTLQTASGPLRAKTDRDGAYHIRDVAVGAARLVVARSGYARAERAIRVERPVQDGRPVVLDPLNLEEGGTIEGQVVDAHGEAVSGARVAEGAVPTYLPSGPAAGIVVTNRQGEFKLVDLAEGDVNVEAFAPELGRGKLLGIRVRAGRTTTGIRITISPDTARSQEPESGGGVAITLQDRSAGEVVVVNAATASEAERAGVQAGDRLLSIDGRPVGSAHEAERRLFGPVSDDAVLEVLRGDTKHKLRVGRERIRQ
ncbi:MAG TPA: carboxypeptidase regulatory-like domain-containing protein [Polyangiaceae bacterium]|nr:carboxypeptidase regulatory-like domain-containing protein [Polyangiaceae bacterium]